jgi:hypothetical protein
MWENLIFRGSFLIGLTLAVWKWGDWKNWRDYYHSLLFVMVVNLSARLLCYLHPLWIFNPDALVTTLTVAELINTYTVLPATVFVYLSKFPKDGAMRKCVHILMWVGIYGGLEYIDTKQIGSISYANGWSVYHSVVFDVFMFIILRIHHVRPIWGWFFTLIVASFIVMKFGFLSAEMK